MSATALAVAVVSPRRSLPRLLMLYAKEAKYELLKNVRIPVYAISTVALPLMFYVLFGIVLGPSNPVNRGEQAAYVLTSMGCFGVIAVALFGFGVSLALERGQGWLQVKRASPMPLAAYFAGKLVSAVVFSTVVVLLLAAVGYTFGGVRMPTGTAAGLLGILVAGALPFSALGMAIGYFARPNSAPGLVNLIYLPMSFCSGLWVPLFLLPRGLRLFARFLPAYHLSQLALGRIGAAAEPGAAWGHIQALIAFTLVFLGIAAWGFKRDEGKTYG